MQEKNGNNLSRKLNFNYYIFGNFDLCPSIADSMSNLMILYQHTIMVFVWSFKLF